MTNCRVQNSARARLCCHWLPLDVKPRPHRPLTPRKDQSNLPSVTTSSRCLTYLMLDLHSCTIDNSWVLSISQNVVSTPFPYKQTTRQAYITLRASVVLDFRST